MALLPYFSLSYSLPTFVLYICIAIAGAASIGGQILLLAYMSQFYSSNIRATGLGMALGIGRLGAILGPILCALVTEFKFTDQI